MPPTARPWFRFYSDILDNLKAEKLNDRQFRRWIKLLALANVTVPRGQLPAMEKIAFRLRVNEATVKTILEELVAMGFIDSKRGIYTLHDWREWQKDRDVTASKRDANVTPSSPDSHANVTQHAPDRHAREEKSREERDQEKEKSRRDRDLNELASTFAKFGVCNERTADLVEDAYDIHGFEAVKSAISTAAGSNIQDEIGWNYVKGILEKPHDERTHRNNGTPTPRRSTTEGYDAAAAERELYASLTREPPISLD